MIMAEYTEKRLDARAEINEDARYKIIGEQQAAVGYTYETAKTKNISRGGLCMQMPHRIEEGNVIRVEIPLRERSIKAFCEVQWCREEEKHSYDVGLSFIALKEDDLEVLGKYIDQHGNRAF